jgi:Fic family protein
MTILQLLNEIHQKNHLLQIALGYDDIKKNHSKELFLKIADTTLLKYKIRFVSNDQVDVNAYYGHLWAVAHIMEQIVSSSHLDESLLCWLHAVINKNIVDNEDILWVIRNAPIKTSGISQKYQKELTDKFVSHYSVKKRLAEAIDSYNTSVEKEPILAIIRLFIECLSRIHVFLDGNGRTFQILLDTLLFRSGYFPLFLAEIKKDWDDISESFIIHRQTKKLENDFLQLILRRYAHYQIA